MTEQTKKSDGVERIDRGSVVVAVPKERNVHQDAFMYFVEIAKRGYDWLHLPYARNDIARNKFAAGALRGGYDWLVMLDSDHKHPPSIVDRLLRWPEHNPDVRIVGGLNFRRGAPYDPCAFVKGDDGNTYTLVDWEQGLIRVDALGTASILIHTSVFEEIEFPWFGYEYESVKEPDDTYPGTDIWFSTRCREAGIAMYVDTTTTSPHHFDNWVTERTYRSYLQANKERVAESVGWSQIVKDSDSREAPSVYPIGIRTEETIADILGDNGRILELGSGEGTGRLAERGYEMTSVEHDKEYVGKYPSNYIHASIVPNGSHDWYDAGILKRDLPEPGEYDLLLVDGPPGHVGRLGMLQHLDLFDLDVPIIIDDVHRNADRHLLEEVAKAAGRSYRVILEAGGKRAVGVID